MSQTLRPYQRDALDQLRAKLRSHRRLLLVSPTGSGKTTIAAEMIHSATSRGNRVLFLAHRKELIDQCSTRLDQFAVPHGVIMAGHRRYQPLLPVQIASVPTLVRRAKPVADLIVIDEAHHARAGTYQQILDAYPGTATIGLSATPWRTDGKGLGELFEDVVVAATPQALVDQGHLVPARGWAFDAPDLSGVRTKNGDFDQAGLELVMGAAPLMGNVVQCYLDHARGKCAVLFAVSVKHSLDLVERFQAAGVAAEHVDGETPKEDREAILARLASGRTQLVSNVGVLTEGWDLPQAEVCILARATQSLGLYLQMVGRILRPYPGKAAGLIHDHGGNVTRHGRPEEERDYSLEADVKKGKTKKPPPMATCAECYAVYLAALGECPECGIVNPSREYREPAEVAAAKAIAIESIARIPEKVRRDEYRALRREGDARGFQPGWAAHEYKKRFGEWPPWRWQQRWAA